MGKGSFPQAFNGQTYPPEMIQSLGIRTAPATQTDFSRTLRAYGTVEADESRLRELARTVFGELHELLGGVMARISPHMDPVN